MPPKSYNSHNIAIASDIVGNLQKIQKAMDKGLTNEINSFKEQVATVLAEQEQGKANVTKKLEELE